MVGSWDWYVSVLRFFLEESSIEAVELVGGSDYRPVPAPEINGIVEAEERKAVNGEDIVSNEGVYT